MAVTRAQWRDAIRRPGNPLSPTARHVALTMADYWPKPREMQQYLWCAVETIVGHTGLSDRTVRRAITELRDRHYLRQEMAAAQHRSPRYQPRIPDEALASVPASPPAEADESIQGGHSDHSQGGHPVQPGWSEWPGTLDGLHTSNPSSGLSCADAAAPAPKSEAEIPIQRDGQADDRASEEEFEDWRQIDRELFEELVGTSHIRATGRGSWSKGEWPVQAFYQAFRKTDRKKLDWPGRYLEALEDGSGVEDFLLSQGLEPFTPQGRRR